jgi:capsular exopolysaccharide synthesis family protein
MDPLSQPLDANQSDLQGLLALLRRQRVPILACAIAAAGAAYVLSLQQPDKFQATARVLYTDTGTGGSIGGGDPARAVDTFVQLASTDDVLTPVAKHLRLTSTDEIRAATSVTADATANLINVSATGDNADAATQLANGVASGLVDWRESNRRRQLQARIDYLEGQLRSLAGKSSPSELAAAADIRTQLSEQQAQLNVPNPELTLVSLASEPGAPFSPKPLRNAVFGLLAGLVLGFGLGMLRDRLDRRLRSVEEIESSYPWPTLGVVPLHESGRDRRTGLVDFSEISGLADAYRNIRTNLTLVSLNDETQKVWAISSAMPGEGKSAAAANLAGAFASSGMRVLAISADLHAPTLHEYFNQEHRARPGLIEVLARQVRADEAAVEATLAGPSSARGGSLHIIGNERVFSDPATLFQSPMMGSLLDWARQKFDVVVLDAPPLLYTAEASLLGRLADGLILVARINHLTRNEAMRASRLLQTVQIRPTGVIMSGAKSADLGYGYGYRAGAEDDLVLPAPKVAPRRSKA